MIQMNSQMEEMQGVGMEEVQCFHALPRVQPSRHLHIFQLAKLSRPHSLRFLWRVHYVSTFLIISDELNIQLLFLSQRSGNGTENSIPPVTWLVPLAASPHPVATQEHSRNDLIRVKDVLITSDLGTLCWCSHHSENDSSLRSSQEPRSKSKYEDKRFLLAPLFLRKLQGF